MTYSVAVVNTKTGIIVSNTISSQVVLFVAVSLIGRIAKKTGKSVGTVNK
jgi:hypothetical protein